MGVVHIARSAGTAVEGKVALAVGVERMVGDLSPAPSSRWRYPENDGCVPGEGQPVMVGYLAVAVQGLGQYRSSWLRCR